MKVFAGGIATETNTFSPIPTGAADFAVLRAADLAGGPEIAGYGSVFKRLEGAIEARGGEFVFSLYAFAQPAGLTTRSAYEGLRDEMLADLQAALPVDAVFLLLHGAMVADGYDDCETDIVARVRRIVGPDVKIGVEFDLHSDLNDALLESADALVLYKEYPHVDVAERALDLLDIISAAAEGRIRPTMARFECRMIGVYPTTAEPMRGFVDDMLALEGKGGVLSVSLAHGFPWGDVPTCGTQMLVITDNDPLQARRLAAEWGRRFFAMRRQVDLKSLPMDEALDKALAAERGPVVVADQSDNAGGGAPSDSTFALQALLHRGVTGAALALMWDPVVVQLACAAGVGAQLDVRLGGKIGTASGDPLDLSVRVAGIVRELVQHWPQQDGGAIAVPAGDAVALHCQGIDAIVNSKRSQVFSPEVFTTFGIDVSQQRLLVVKSTQHFFAAFAPIAAEIVYMAAPGAITPRIKEIPYQRVDRDKYPWVDDPFARQDP
jgi:microcystin degradation protein MlrC